MDANICAAKKNATEMANLRQLAPGSFFFQRAQLIVY
jgi:hypothetical protein